MDPRLRTELWTSWASLLRSYSAAHGLNSRHHAVVEVGETRLRYESGADGFASRTRRFKTVKDTGPPSACRKMER